MGEVQRHGDILVLDERDGHGWTQYQGFIDRLVELGIWFPFDQNERPPVDPPEDLSPFRLIVAPRNRQDELCRHPLILSYVERGGLITYLRSDPLSFPDDCTEPAVLDWVSRNDNVEHWLTGSRPRLRDPRLRERLCSRDDRVLARALLASADRENRRYMTYGDFPSVYWYAYLTCADVAGRSDCLDSVERQMVELCSASGGQEQAESIPWTQMGSIPAWLYQLTGNEQYKRYAERVAEAFLAGYPLQPRGFFTHHSDWTCGEIDEACARSLGRAGQVLDRPGLWHRVIRHFRASYQILGDPASGLAFHAGGEWGHTPVIWGRGMGWSIWGLVQALGAVADGTEGRDQLLLILQRYADGLAACQAPDGLWRNLMHRQASDTESSCTAMFVACLSRSLREGWIPNVQEYTEMCERGWNGLKSRIWQGWLTGCCTGMAMSMNEHYYWQRPFVRAMPFLSLWAACEYLAWRGIDW